MAALEVNYWLPIKLGNFSQQSTTL